MLRKSKTDVNANVYTSLFVCRILTWNHIFVNIDTAILDTQNLTRLNKE